MNQTILYTAQKYVENCESCDIPINVTVRNNNGDIHINCVKPDKWFLDGFTFIENGRVRFVNLNNALEIEITEIKR